MSLIFDALRKSEAERRLGQAPTLTSVGPWETRRRSRAWLPWLLVIVVAAIGGVGWWQGQHAKAPAVVAAPPAAKPVAPASAPRVETPPAPAPVVATPPAPAPVVAKPPAPKPAPAKAELKPEPKVEAPPAPVAPPAPLPVAAAPAPVAPPPASDVPELGELPSAFRQSLPPMKLTLHYFNAEPARRFVLINGVRAIEGQPVEGGMTVVEIRADGVVLEFRGTRFFLSR